MRTGESIGLSGVITGEASATSQHAAFHESRTRTLALIDGVREADLVRVISPLLSPLLWDLGHIANFEQRWLLDGGDEQFNGMYDPFLTPRAGRGSLPLLEGEDCFAYMQAVREQTQERLDLVDPFLIELVIQHEQQHNETMLQLLRMLDSYEPEARLRCAASGPAGPPPATRWIEIPAGSYTVGSVRGEMPRSSDRDGGFCYDNEQAAHVVDLSSFLIASRPVTNGEFAEWIDAGGYERMEWWSPAGREWLASANVAAPFGWLSQDGCFLETGFGEPRPIDPDAPVIQVSWFEADAFARSLAARLPTEYEWEVAASIDPANSAAGRTRYPWGEGEWRPDLANLDQLGFGTVPSGALDAASPGGCHDLVGQVWEWTSSVFSAYPGFSPFCYAEYSAPFFDRGFRVLRGGSWATRARGIDNRFRNWDLPERRQIFSGFRLAKET